MPDSVRGRWKIRNLCELRWQEYRQRQGELLALPGKTKKYLPAPDAVNASIPPGPVKGPADRHQRF
jgi:hypothetical protein